MSRCTRKTKAGPRCKRKAAAGRKTCGVHGAPSTKSEHGFKVKLVAPEWDDTSKRLKQLQSYANKIVRTAGYQYYSMHSGLTTGHYMFYFEGPEKKIRRSHSKLKKIRSKSVHVYAVKKA